MQTEYMRDIPNFEGLYAITEDGKVWGYKRKKFLKPAGGAGNYQMLMLCKDGKGYQYYIHQLVAITYIPNPCGYKEVNHKDEHKDHNHWTNLEWCDRKYNVSYGNRGTKQSTTTKGRPKPQIQCPYCDKLISKQNIKKHLNTHNRQGL